jgi:hypothetical protein
MKRRSVRIAIILSSIAVVLACSPSVWHHLLAARLRAAIEREDPERVEWLLRLAAPVDTAIAYAHRPRIR